MFDGQTIAGSTIDATRWARSAGLDTRCWISTDLLTAIAPQGARDRADDLEKVAAAAMAILGRVRRALDGADTVRLVFKAGAGGNDQPLEATYVADEQGRVLLVRRA